MANLYDKAGLVNIPVGYQDGFLYNIKPTDNTLGFRFNRDSAATRVNKEGLIEQVGYFGPELVQNGNFSELGPELVVNGDFATDSDWTKGTGWSIENGVATLDGTQVGGSNLGSSIMSVTSGKTYKVVVNVISKSLGFRLYDSYGVIAYGLSIGENVFYRTVTSSTYQVTPLGLSGATGSIDNVSVKQVDPNNYWTKAANWNISGGTANADGTSLGALLQSVSLAEIGKKYLLKFSISNYTSGNIRVYYGGVFTDFVTANGDYTQTITAISTSGDFQTSMSSAFNGSITNISVVEVKGDKPRIDYTDSLTSPSFLLEPQSTNLITYSEDFSNSVWTTLANGETIVSNSVISPDGSLNADTLEGNGTATTVYVRQNVTLNTSVDYTFSIFAKKGTNDFLGISAEGFSGATNTIVIFDLNNGLVTTGTANIEDYGNGWFRCSYTIPISTDGTGRFLVYSAYNGSTRGFPTSSDANGQNIYLWGAQLEQLPYATSYIPTSGSTVTRTQETCNGAGSASTFNSTEGVLYAEISALADDGTYRIISLSNSTSVERIYMQYRNASNTVSVVVKNGSVTQANIGFVLPNETDFNKIAFKYKSNDFALWVNGFEVGTDTSGSTPIGLSELAFDSGTGNNPFYGNVKGVYVFNEALTDDELQQLTGPEYNSFAALAAAYNYTVI